MRFVFCFLLSVFFVFGGSVAHADPLYNSKYSTDRDGGTTLYNSRAGVGQGGPIMLRNMLRAPKKDTVMGKSGSVYSPYNMGGRKSGYALSMTPDEVRAKKARDQARAKERAKELERQRKARKLAQNEESRVKQETQDYTSRFRDSADNDSEEPVLYSKKRKRSVYVRDEDGMTTPEKVFNSLY